MDRYILDYSLKNAIGRPSVSLYLTGCDKPIKCKDCHNYELQNQSHNDYDIQEIKQNIDKFISEFLNMHNNLNVSILGGEPLSDYNINIAYEISEYIKNTYDDSRIFIFTWRTLGQIKKENKEKFLKHFDYGVFGEYDSNLHVEDTLPSSTNQYIYDFNKKETIDPIRLKRGW